MKLTKVTGANSHQNLSVVAGSAGFWRDNKGRKWEEKSQSQLVTLCNSLKVFKKHLYANTLTEPLEIKDLISRSHAQECEM